ncbi:Glu/Leu/Phe/Val dehydrogenase dimerization domain-containing protein [Desulfobaculum sp. SPO524]|uniref:Glu/Leu/Phe/Val dehydrogenase dimerization domain-containing protein n=1 Tax=Desulfobaculum sp. SPO524 TaxID=3378071 RepID=UPI0038549661
MSNVKELLTQFEQHTPNIVFEWNDSETDAQGWVVINSLRGNAAGGGTRMRKGLDKHEVVSLAKTMEIKFAVSGPQIGGAKSGINFDPTDPRKEDVLRRWYKAVSPLLKSYYGTGGDLNVDELKEVSPLTEMCGLWHPLEGVVNGHFADDHDLRIQKIGQLRGGVSLPVYSPQYSPDTSRRYCVADLITGWGVAESARIFYELYGSSIKGKRVIVQGFGNVGATAAYYAAQNGAKIVGIIDRGCGLVEKDGLTFEQVRELFLNRDGNTLNAEHPLSCEETQKLVWNVGADVFMPCAASRLVTMDNLKALKASGLELITCGANVPFDDNEIFYGPTAEFADQNFSVIPDFIANSGMARAFNYFMSAKVDLNTEAIFEDTTNTIYNALKAVHEHATGKTGRTATALELFIKKIMN